MKNKIKGLLALALAAFTSLTWAAELVIPYSFDGKTGNTEYAYEYQVKMPSEALTSFTTTIRYSGGSHRVEILSVKLIDGETEYTAVATGTDGTVVADEGSYSGGNNYLNIFTFTNEEGFTANKVYTLQAMLKVTNNPPSHNGNIKVSGGITLYVPPYSFGVNFTTAADQNISTTEGAGFSKGTYAKPINWGNFQGTNEGNGTITVANQTIKVYWTARGGSGNATWNSGANTSTDDGKLLYGYLDDTVNDGRIKATVTITGLPSDKRYAVALILSGDGANNTDCNGKFSPALINGQTYSYVNGALVSGDAAKADNAKTWGDRSTTAAAAGLAEGTNVMFVEGLSGSILTITSAMEAQNTSRLTIAGVQVWTTEDAPVAPAAPTDKEVVSLNFYSSQGSVSGEAGLVAAQGWNNLAAGGTETTLAVWNGEEAVNYPISLTYSANNGHQYTDGVTDNYIKGYLDDGGSQAQVTVKNIPFEEYSVIVYAATDTEARKFKPVLINGSYYAGVATPTAYGYADFVLEGEKDLRSWGASRNAVAAYGKNALRVDGLSGDLTIKGGSNGDGARGGIAAIQIINTGAELSDEQIIDWTAVANPKASELPELTKPFVQLKLADGVILEVDAAIAAGHFIEIVGNNVTVNITKIELGKADVEAIVSGAASVNTSYSETLGYTKDGVTYPLIFRGTTDASWATLSNWYIGTRTQGETTYWIPYDKKVVPGASNSDEWRTTLVDGNLMAITAGDDGYEAVNAPKLEGWASKITVANGAHLTLADLVKLQGACEWHIDDSSKITLAAFSNGNNDDSSRKFYVNAPEGLTVGGTFGAKVAYYFDEDGSAMYATLNNPQTIAAVTLDLGTADEGRKIVTRKLIGFTAGNATFSVAEGAVTATAEDVTLETAEILQNVGQYKFEQKNDGCYVSYVAYAETDEIGDMNTWTKGEDANWDTAANWSLGFAPAESANATIYITENTTITIPAEGVTVGTLIVNGDGTLTIAGGKLAATKIYANANITASETTLALAPMNIEAGKTVTYAIGTTGEQKVPALTGAGVFAKAGVGQLTMDKDSACDASITVNAGTLLFHAYAYDKTYNIVAKDGAKIQVGTWAGSLTSTSNTLKLEGGAMLQLNNGNPTTGAIIKGTIVIDSTAEKPAVIKGNENGNNGVIAATIKGNGVLEIQDVDDNFFTISGVIADGDAEGDVLAVKVVTDRGVTFTGANTYTGGTVIDEGATLNAGMNSLGTGAVTGAGKLVVAGYPSNETVRNSLGAAEWTGLYVNTANNTMRDTGNWFGAVGNAGSSVEFSGTSTGYLAPAGSANFALIVSGSITFSDGNSSNGGYTFNGSLSGAGTLATSGNPTDVLKFLGETKDFAGTITVGGGHCISFGDQDDDDSKRGMLVIKAGKTANIAAGKTWTAVNGIEVAGTIGGEGTIGSTLILLNGATLANAMTLEGNVTVAEGTDINHAYATAAGDTVITCANAEAVAAALTGAPQGLKYVAENGAVKLAVANVSFVPATAESMSVTVDATTKEAALEMVVIQRPEGVGDSVVSADAYAAYFTKTATGESGNWTVTVTLKDDVKPVIGTTDDAGDAFTVDADGVTIAIANYKPGLYYGIRSATELGALKTVQAVGVNVVEGKISVDKLNGNSAFYQIDVDAKPFPESSNAQ